MGKREEGFLERREDCGFQLVSQADRLVTSEAGGAMMMTGKPAWKRRYVYV